MNTDPPGASLLTPTEVKILSLISVGMSDREVAEELSLGVDAVEIYIEVLLEKIQAPNRLQAVFWAGKNL
jgi:DNA-binding NarL/FixJ family response regulator